MLGLINFARKPKKTIFSIVDTVVERVTDRYRIDFDIKKLFDTGKISVEVVAKEDTEAMILPDED